MKTTIYRNNTLLKRVVSTLTFILLHVFDVFSEKCYNKSKYFSSKTKHSWQSCAASCLWKAYVACKKMLKILVICFSWEPARNTSIALRRDVLLMEERCFCLARAHFQAMTLKISIKIDTAVQQPVFLSRSIVGRYVRGSQNCNGNGKPRKLCILPNLHSAIC